ncbi:hypothetical protein CRE_15345 [Caenorhabditis remanei]|uniref:Uncharacterized protein n=1 Tax=Caenorhabditis remanei TaxID=31234 RepID=E3MCD4_CAERE|nr:hypothetical protein CRE_15345 [Caenorhabditis remanei]
MIYNEHMLQLIWIIIFSAILIVFAAIILRCIFLYLLEKNVCNLQTIFSNTRILQTAKEKKICNALDVSLQKTFKVKKMTFPETFLNLTQFTLPQA